MRENIIKISVVSGLVIILILLSFPVINAGRELGADTKFGKLLIVQILAVVDQSGSVKYTVDIKDERSFGRLGKVAQVSHGNISFVQGEKIAKALGIKGNSKKVENLGGIGERYVWQSGGKILNISTETGEFNHSSSEPTPEVGLKYTSEVKKLAESILNKSGMLGKLKVIREIPVELKGPFVVKNTGYSNGSEVVFTKEYNGYEITNKVRVGYASLVVGFDKKIRKFSYLLPAKILNEGIYPTISAKDAINKLKDNKAIIYKVEVDGVSSLENNIILSSVNINEMKTVYIDNPGSDYLLPYYLFNGDGITTDDRKVGVSLLVNAIKEKYLE